MGPDLGYTHLSPSDLAYSSPTESEACQTPFMHSSEHHFQPVCPHIVGTGHAYLKGDENGSKSVDHPCDAVDTPPRSQLFMAPSSQETPHHALQLSPLVSFDPDGSPFELDPFAASFSFVPNDGGPVPPPDCPSLAVIPSLEEHHPSSPTRAPQALHKLNAGLLLNLRGRYHSPRFPVEHTLNPFFVRTYELGDELGSGGYGFVMTAHNRMEGHEVAVKFIIKAKVPEHAWMEDETIGRLPTEVMLLSFIDHENIVKCLDLFEDSLYFYLVQELHGSPWPKNIHSRRKPPPGPHRPQPIESTPPLLSPCASEASVADSEPATPLHLSSQLDPYPPTQGSENGIGLDPHKDHHDRSRSHPQLLHEKQQGQLLLPPRPDFSRRPSHDLFECIEQSDHKRLPEDKACYIFAQVVEAVYYLDCQGVTHRDIKDENLVIDKDLKVKLIDFGSAIVVNPDEPRPYYTLFFGTTAYASSEILLKKPYQAPPAEIWTLGILLSYLLTGMSPFPTEKDAIEGRIVLTDTPGTKLSKTSLSLLQKCLDPDPEKRITIGEVRAHRWLRSCNIGR